MVTISFATVFHILSFSSFVSMINWNTIILAIIGAGGFWVVVKTLIDKQKTAYDMLMTTITELKDLYTRQSEEFKKEKLDSAEKSAVISKTHKCLHRFNDPNIVCPVEEANDERLKNRCSRCEYNPEADDNR